MCHEQKEFKTLLGLSWTGPDWDQGLSGLGLSCRCEHGLAADIVSSGSWTPQKNKCASGAHSHPLNLNGCPRMCSFYVRYAAYRVRADISPLWGWWQILPLLLKSSCDKRGIWASARDFHFAKFFSLTNWKTSFISCTFRPEEPVNFTPGWHNPYYSQILFFLFWWDKI